MTKRTIKPICFYLPQYYTFRENDEWWGEGFTEWTNVRKASPLFSWHKQPQKPIDLGYYELNHNHHQTMARQIELAKEYGVYGFCFYHYWFKDGKRLLEVPVEKFLTDQSLDIHFCLSWANEPWTRAWDGGNKSILMPQEYGDKKEWEDHFNYLLPFFKDDRYIRNRQGVPILIIYRPELIDCLDEMLLTWQEMAVDAGLSGIDFIAQGSMYNTKQNKSKSISKFIMYEPGYTLATFSVRRLSLFKAAFKDPKLFTNIQMQKVKVRLAKYLNLSAPIWNTTIIDYDLVWKDILSRNVSSVDYLPGAFTDWDNSPRRGGKGSRVLKGATPISFKHYMTALLKKVLAETDEELVFITAWNEWAEGAHLEPDETNRYGYLEGLREALLANGITKSE